MGNKKKLFWEVLFLIAVFGITVYSIFHGEDLGRNLQIIKDIKKVYLIPAVLCVVCFIGGESVIMHYLLRTLDIRIQKRSCFLFSAIGFFYSCITPSASGGQPAQLYYMRQKNIPVPIATQVLLIITITYKAVLVLFGLGITVFGQGVLHRYMSGYFPIFYLGITLNVICIGAMILLTFNTGLAESILSRCLSFLEKIKIMKRRESLRKRLEEGMVKYGETSEYFSKHHGVVINVLIITTLQRTALFLSTFFIYRAFDLKGTAVFTIILLQAIISVSVDMLPLPGGMGISEKLFLKLFLPVFGTELVLPGMILSRGISYYTQLLLCAVLSVPAHFILKKKFPENKSA